MNARDRLLIAAARAYQTAHEVPASEPVEARARFMDRERLEYVPDIEVEVTVSLRDLIAVTRAAKDGELCRHALEREREENMKWWRDWFRARECFRNDGRSWKSRASAALRELGLLGRTKRELDNGLLLARWSTLTDPNVGPPEGPRLSQRAALLLLAAEKKMEPGTLKQRLYREGVKIGVRDL